MLQDVSSNIAWVHFCFSFTDAHVAPEFTRNLTDGVVKEMENFIFTVSFKGNPKPEISWYHNNLLIHQQQAYQVRYHFK